MTVADKRGGMGKEGGVARDQFPIGMRVLAVDDDPTCLKMLEVLLLNCRYHVTTTDRATMALKLLRENKGYFDLVISDVHMPDMDGFKLLELVGLEMDLPVIMLSANGQTETVLKGINHGACDYLVKPVRIQELKNIWQHVIRRKKSDAQDESNSDGEDNSKAQTANSEGGQHPVTSEASDPNERFNRKRKEQNEENEDDSEETASDDGSTQKKQRVVWSIELHRKFVDAVNRLGIDRAVPKKILDAMNVDKLTRENVASHLQKYRLYLRRITANHQANMAAALIARHHSYRPMGQLEGFRNVHPLGGSRQLPNMASFRPNGVFGRMDTSTGFRPQGITSSRAAQHGHVPNTSYCMNDGVLGKANVNYLQGMPMSLDLDRLQQCNTVKEESNPYAGSFYGNGLIIGSSSNSIPNATNNPLVLPTSQQLKQSGTLGCHSSLRFPSLSSDSYKLGLGDTSHFPDLGEHNNTWQGAVPSKDYSANISPTSVLTSCNDIEPHNILGNGNPNFSHMDSDLHDGSSSSVAVTTLCDSGIESCIQSQGSSVGGNTDTNLMATCAYENSKFLSNSEPNWNELNKNLSHNSNLLFGFPPSLSNLHLKDTVAENPVLNNGVLDKGMEINASLAQDFRTDHQPNYVQECPADNIKLNDGFNSNNCSFPDLGNDDLPFFESDIIDDFFSDGTCM